MVQEHKDNIINALIKKAEQGHCPAANVLLNHAGLTLSEPTSAQPEADLAGLLLNQLRIELQNSADEPVATDAPALK